MLVPRIPIVVGNWKMNGLTSSLIEIESIALAMSDGRAGQVQCAICPPFTLLHQASKKVIACDLLVGAQDCSSEVSGPYTGDVSAEMLRDAGADLVIVGHSERRQRYRETSDTVRSKATAAFRAGLITVVCVGETQADHDAGRSFEVVGNQLEGSIPRSSDTAKLIVAYEPVWAIGSGKAATAPSIAAMHSFIRERLRYIFGALGTAIPILYGGSVSSSTIKAMKMIEDLNGVLVGGASLAASTFVSVLSEFTLDHEL